MASAGQLGRSEHQEVSSSVFSADSSSHRFLSLLLQRSRKGIGDWLERCRRRSCVPDEKMTHHGVSFPKPTATIPRKLWGRIATVLAYAVIKTREVYRENSRLIERGKLEDWREWK